MRHTLNIEDKPVVTGGKKKARRGNAGVGEQEAQTTKYKISYKDAFIRQHGEYSQYLTITINGDKL